MSSLRSALALLSALVWLQPPAVLPLPSRSGPDGPPRPYGVEPAPGGRPPHTERALIRAQNRVLLAGPFPHRGLARGISEGIFLSEQAPVRELALARSRAVGATVVRIPVNWRDLVQASPPGGFQGRDPASPAYHFGRIDAAVLSAVGAGLEPLLVVSHAPAFAEAPNRWPYAYPGSWDPSPAALRDFAVALARRYDGSFSDPLRPGSALPRVRLFQAWNEPNLSRYLEPQWVVRRGRWSAFSPLLYRQLLNGFYAGVKSVEPSDTVVAAGIAPEGEPVGSGVMAPVGFLRGLLCLQDPGCPDPPHLDVLAFHPLSVSDPDIPAASALDVSIADLGKVTGLLHRAERLRTVLPVGSPKPLWITELNWQSAPQSPRGVPDRFQAAWVARALHRLWVAGVGLATWHYLVDPYRGVSLSSPTGGIQELPRPAGLYYAGVGGDLARARPKPFLQGFAFPFDPLRLDRGHVRIWALLMRPGERVSLQRQGQTGRWSTIARLHADRHGVLNALRPLVGDARLRLLSDRLQSASARPGPVPRPGYGSSRAPPRP